MQNMKQDANRKNDPMSILNQLKKLKSKGKTRTPRPTMEVKSSRVESTTAVLVRKDLQSINSRTSMILKDSQYPERKRNNAKKIDNKAE